MPCPFIQSGDSTKAKETFIKLVNLGPSKDYIFSNADLFYDLGNINQALQCHKHALKQLLIILIRLIK